MKSKILATIAVLGCLLSLGSCRNISAQDFGPGDIVNILEVVMGKESSAPEPGTQPTGANEAGETEASEATEASETTETSQRPETPETSGRPTEPASPAPTPEATAPKTTVQPETEPATEKPPETTNPHYETGAATNINIRDLFPEAPEKFWNVPYPESVPMLESVKKGIRELSGFSARDFNGFSFYVATTDSKLFTPFYGGGPLSDARRYRTEIVEAECNAQIITLEEKPKELIVQEIKLAEQSDEFYADILCVPFEVQSELIRNGLLMNLKKVPFLNLHAEYYNASATEAFTINGNIFGTVSDLTFDPATVYAVFYNRSLVDRYALTSPLATYKNGAWDWDAMFSVSKELAAAAADFDGGQAYSIGFDGESDDLANGLFIASGNRYFTKRDYNYPIMNFANDRTKKLVEVLSAILSPPGESGMENFLEGGDAAQANAFAKGNMLFSISKLEMLPEITDSKFDWGLLPVPSTESNRENRFSFAGRDALCISVPYNTRSSEACGILIGALSAASHKLLKDVYVKEQMTFHLRDVDSVGILDEIIGSMAFNQYNAFVSLPEMREATVGVIKDAASKKVDFSERYEKGKSELSEFFAGSQTFLHRR